MSSGELVETKDGQAAEGDKRSLLHKVTEHEVLTPQETKALILATTPGVYRTIIMAAVFSGARISELLALR